MFVRFLCVLLSPCLAYNQTIGLQLAYLEKAVYCGQEAFDKWQVGESVVKGPKVNTSQLRFITSSEQAAAGVGRMLEPDGCFVAMRGTFGVISSLLDAVFWPMDFEHALCPSCQVDSGFYLAYLSVRDKIFRALADFGCHQRPLYLVGHSQGAASLTYLLFDALMKAFTVQHMYALESPRPGNGKFAEALGKLLGKTDAWRVVHYQDIVPHLPPRGGLFGYEHALPEIYYPQRVGAKYVECGLEDLKCSSQWWPWQLTGGDHDWYADIDPCVCAVQEEANPLNFLSGPFFT